MGIDLRTGRQVILADNKHSLILGRTGSGKSSTVIARILMALITDGTALLVIDGGQDPFLFYYVLSLAAAARRQVVLLSDKPTLRNSRIDPVRAGGPMTLDEAINLILGIAGIAVSKNYGQSWFAVAGIYGLTIVLREMEARRIPIGFDTVVHFIESRRNHRGSRLQDTEHLRYLLSILLEYRHVIGIDVDPSELGWVRWKEIEESGAVVFVSLDLTQGTTSFLGSTVLESYLAYRRSSYMNGANDIKGAIVADEVQRMLGDKFGDTMTGIRKTGTTLYISAQSAAQIRSVSAELEEIIVDQASYFIDLTPDTERTQKFIQQFSEDVVRGLGSKTHSIVNPSTGERDYITPRLTKNELKAVAQTPNCGVLVNRAKDGICEPTLIYLEHLMTRETFEYLSTKPMPRKLPAPETPEAIEGAVAEAPSSDRRKRGDDAEYIVRAEKIRAMAKRLTAWLSGA
jgi:hypothetical protein